jgi:hypothetical protein
MVQKIAKEFLLLLLIVITIIVFFRFVCFLAINSWVQNMEIDYKLVPIDVFSLFISSVITIWLGYYVVKKLSEQRFEKEMLINDLKQIEEKVREVEDIFENSDMIDLGGMSVKMNTVRHLVDRFVFTVQIAENDIEKDIEPINDTLNNLYMAATNFDSPTVSRNDIDVATILHHTNDLITNVRRLTISLNNK